MDVPEATGAVAWVTGAASGLGAHFCGALLARGSRVMASDVAMERLEARAAAEGWPAERAWLGALDVRDPAAWQAAGERLFERWGRLDLLLNVAGILHPGSIASCTDEDIDRHLDINVKGVVLGSREAARRMLGQGSGHIVNVASLAGVAPVPGIALYSASKFAVRGFTLALAEELRASGVRVTVLCPDAIETPMLALQEDFEEAALTFSGRRPLTVEEVAVALFDKILPDAPAELLLPRSRGLQAKVAGAFPRLASLMVAALRKKGLARQRRRRARRPGP